MLICPLEVTIHLYTAYFTIQDVDGIVKPTLDLFQKQGIIENDNLILDLHVYKHKTVKGDEHLQVTIQKLKRKAI